MAAGAVTGRVAVLGVGNVIMSQQSPIASSVRSGGIPLAALHAGMHARQPMHSVPSYNRPSALSGISCLVRASAGEATDVAASAPAPPANPWSNFLRVSMASSALPLGLAAGRRETDTELEELPARHPEAFLGAREIFVRGCEWKFSCHERWYLLIGVRGRRVARVDCIRRAWPIDDLARRFVQNRQWLGGDPAAFASSRPIDSRFA
jgi:hypothetical protein